MERSLVEIVQTFSDETPYLLIWLDDEIKLETNIHLKNDIIEIHYVLAQKDVLLEEMCKDLTEEDLKFVKDSIHYQENVASFVDNKPIVEPIHMSNPK